MYTLTCTLSGIKFIRINRIIHGTYRHKANSKTCLGLKVNKITGLVIG